jgi:hypothetical protein
LRGLKNWSKEGNLAATRAKENQVSKRVFCPGLNAEPGLKKSVLPLFECIVGLAESRTRFEKECFVNAL